MSLRQYLCDLCCMEDEGLLSADSCDFFAKLGRNIGRGKEFNEEDRKDLYYNIIEAIRNECQKYYEDSADYYIKAYEICKDKYPYLYGELKNKFLKMKYLDAYKYYNELDYSKSIDKLKELLNNKYITYDTRKDCRKLLLNCLYRFGKNEYNDGYYSYALELFEEALNTKKHGLYSTWTNYNINDITYYMSLIYEKQAKEYWKNDNIYYMEKSIDLLNKSKNLNRPLSIQNKLELYYYLYKAYNEPSSYRTSILEKAKQFEENGINVTCLYNKSKHISDLYNDISMKQNNISNLNYELNSINNNINNTQAKINAKNIAISIKNTSIRELNNLANTLIEKGRDINSQADESINDTKTQVKEVEKNVKEKKDFAKEIKEFENQKENEIKNMKNNNIILKQKNALLILMLNALESKLF